MTKLRDRHDRPIVNLTKGELHSRIRFEGAPEHLCEDCPLSLRCLAGRLTKQRGTFLCYQCGYLFVEDWVELTAKLSTGEEAPMLTPTKYKFKCEQRPMTDAILAYVQRGSGRLTYISGHVHDPGPGDMLFIKACPWCQAAGKAGTG